ncbi:hypothetical protein P7K49_017398 [Saguinus oedipus]|uniref:Olduvai domain-containing protein n=1 Tax=Saguinus oedipus TaxID=9490 RepID=A0ABQ9V2T8_SAGOE|nr:hypothetical protein P7K49_017398 [Saguinus oedipus]
MPRQRFRGRQGLEESPPTLSEWGGGARLPERLNSLHRIRCLPLPAAALLSWVLGKPEIGSLWGPEGRQISSPKFAKLGSLLASGIPHLALSSAVGGKPVNVFLLMENISGISSPGSPHLHLQWLWNSPCSAPTKEPEDITANFREVGTQLPALQEPWEEPESLMELDTAWRWLSRMRDPKVLWRDQVFLNITGSTCGAPNVSMISSGRTSSRKTTEVNLPDTIENSYSQQEETKPNIRASKNRLLLSQVAYFLNYQLKTNNHDEEQKCRDSKNKLLMSQVAYYLGCRLKTEVPGYLCSAPNISMVASGKPPSRKNTEVNIPEGIEKSCSQQENKANFRASKNRLLMSQVAYFLNYQLKTYNHDEEQKCRDSKNKLLMSQVAYYLGCRLKTEVHGYLCSDPNISMVASGKPPSRKKIEVNIAEGIEISCSWQEDNKLTFGASKNRLLMSQVAYFLNYQLKTYNHDEEQKCRESKNRLLMSQMDYSLKTCEDRQYHEIQKYRESKNKLLMRQAAYYLCCRLKTKEDRRRHEEEKKYRDSKNKLMSQVAHYPGCGLKTEKNDKDEDEDVHVSEAEKIQESCAPREVQKIEVKKVPEESLEECVIACLNSYGPTDSSQPHGDTSEITFEEDNVDPALVVESESSHDVAEDALIILSESQSDGEEEEEKGLVPPRNLQESVEEEAPQGSWDKGYLTLSIPPGTFAFNQPYRSNLHSLEEQQVNLAPDIDIEYSVVKMMPRPGKTEWADIINTIFSTKAEVFLQTSLLSMELVEAEEPEVF